MSIDGCDGFSLADRFRMALRQIGERCRWARQETAAKSNSWIKKWWNETDDSLDSPGSIVDQLHSHSYDWLPECSASDTDVSQLKQCLLHVEVNILKFHKALQLVYECEDEVDEASTAKREAFGAARAILRNLLADLSEMRDQLGLEAPASDGLEVVESSFREKRPPGRNDRYQWEYVIIKQCMEYLDFCGKLFESLARTYHEEL